MNRNHISVSSISLLSTAKYRLLLFFPGKRRRGVQALDVGMECVVSRPCNSTNPATHRKNFQRRITNILWGKLRRKPSGARWRGPQQMEGPPNFSVLTVYWNTRRFTLVILRLFRNERQKDRKSIFRLTAELLIIQVRNRFFYRNVVQLIEAHRRSG